MEKPKYKQYYFLVAFGVILFCALNNIGMVCETLKQIGNLIFPIALGALLAFILNVPMGAIERKLTKLANNRNLKISGTLIRVMALLATLLIIALVITLVVANLIPAFSESISSAAELLQNKWPEIQRFLAQFSIDTTYLSSIISDMNLSSHIGSAVNGAGIAAGHVADFAGSAVSGIISFSIAFVMAIYILLSKTTLGRQAHKLTYAYLKKSWADKLHYVARLIKDTYSKFLSGQCLECVILGTLIFIAFSIFKLPYASLIGLLTGVLAFIPYIGAICACCIGVFLTLLIDPMKAIVAAVVFLVVQLIENQLIYPNVVGNSVGLSPLWTLLAVFVGGKICGVIGMVLFIPLAAVIYTLIRNNVNMRLDQKITTDINT